jgi:hypothetical protein
MGSSLVLPADEHRPESAALSAAVPRPIACRCLLAIHIPLYIDRQGRRWTERLWWVDL